jgi:TolB protein
MIRVKSTCTRCLLLVVAQAGIGLGAGRAQSPSVNYHRPIWLPDGESIVFMSDQAGGDWELYSIALAGSKAHRLTRHGGWDGYASLSPDGRAIVFDRGDDEGGRLVLMELETGATRVLVRGHGEHLGGSHWAPDGSVVYFQWEPHGGRDVYAVSPGGGEPQRVTNTSDDEFDFAVTPDGQSLVVVMKTDVGNRLDLVDIRSGSRSTLLSTSGAVYGVDVSPDGRRIAYNSDEDGDQEIFVVDRAGHHKIQITDNGVPDHLAVWSPDGRRLIFTREGNEVERIVIADVDHHREKLVDTSRWWH